MAPPVGVQRATEVDSSTSHDDLLSLDEFPRYSKSPFQPICPNTTGCLSRASSPGRPVERPSHSCGQVFGCAAKRKRSLKVWKSAMSLVYEVKRWYTSRQCVVAAQHRTGIQTPSSPPPRLPRTAFLPSLLVCHWSVSSSNARRCIHGRYRQPVGHKKPKVSLGVPNSEVVKSANRAVENPAPVKVRPRP